VTARDHGRRRVYAARREVIVDTLSRTFEAELLVVPSTAGLHVAAVACHASVEKMAEVARRAVDVAVQELAWFAHDVPSTPGLVLVYGSIAEDQIAEGFAGCVSASCRTGPLVSLRHEPRSHPTSGLAGRGITRRGPFIPAALSLVTSASIMASTRSRRDSRCG
jgi:hypothetical protein